MAAMRHQIRIWNADNGDIPTSADARKGHGQHLRLSVDGVEISRYINAYTITHLRQNIHEVTLTLTAEVVFGKEGES